MVTCGGSDKSKAVAFGRLLRAGAVDSKVVADIVAPRAAAAGHFV